MTTRALLRLVLVASALAVFAPGAMAQTPADEWPHAVPALQEPPPAPAAADDHHAVVAKMRTDAEKLAELVAQMNAASGTDKIGPMAALVSQLAAKQMKMMDCMAMMHEGGGMGAMMERMKASDAAPDAHEQHHPDATLKP